MMWGRYNLGGIKFPVRTKGGGDLEEGECSGAGIFCEVVRDTDREQQRSDGEFSFGPQYYLHRHPLGLD